MFKGPLNSQQSTVCLEERSSHLLSGKKIPNLFSALSLFGLLIFDS